MQGLSTPHPTLLRRATRKGRRNPQGRLLLSSAWAFGRLQPPAGLGRESLYKALSKDGNPEFATVLKVVQALGLKLTPTAA